GDVKKTFTIDNTKPTSANLAVTPNPAKRNDQLTITFTASETLKSVSVALAGGTATQASATGNAYTFTYNVTGNEPAGTPVTVTVTMTDLAGNVGTATASIGFIFTGPAAPLFASTVPASPGKSIAPAIVGTSAVGTVVRLFINSTC